MTSRREPERRLGPMAWNIAIIDTEESSMSFCSCGLLAKHTLLGVPCGDVQQLERVMSEQTTNAHLDRRHLRAYHRKLQDFLIRAANVDGLGYRVARNSIILYPPDGSQPITVFARNTDRQVRDLVQWYNNHVRPKPEDPSVTDQADEVGPEMPETGDPADGEIVAPQPKLVALVNEADPLRDPDDWQIHFDGSGNPVENFETNGTVWRCKTCIGTKTAYEANNPTGIGGHNRMVHRDRTDLDSEEARAKALDSRRFNRLSRQIEEAVATLAHTIGWEVGPEAIGRIKELEAENAVLRTRLAEAETRLALIRESMGM